MSRPEKNVLGVWEEKGQDPAELEARIASISTIYRAQRPPFCYPGTLLDFEGLDVTTFLKHQHNIIGTHTHGSRDSGVWVAKEAEGGFESLQALEAQVIWMIASTVGGTADNVDGLFCGGGTEGNLQGMWIGRAWLRQRPDPLDRGIAILATTQVHYSILKAASILDIGQAQWTGCPRCRKPHIFCPDQTGAGVNMVGMNEHYQMSVADLERVFKLKYAEGFRRFMVVATVATTTLGAVDPIAEIGKLVRRLHRTTSAHIYVHVDAAFGGFTVPFVDPDRKIGFSVPEVMSMTLDGDKMGRLPYPAGVALCRKDLSSLIARRVNYVRGQEDDSVSGSRGAFAPTVAWYLYNKGGKAEQRRYVQACIDGRNRLAELIATRLAGRVRVLPMDSAVNQLGISWCDGDGTMPEVVLAQLDQEHMRSDLVPRYPTDVLSCPERVYKICVMPHNLRPGIIEAFVDRLAASC